MSYQRMLKKITSIISAGSLIVVMLATGSCVTLSPVTSQDPIIYTSTGQRLTWEHLTFGRQTEIFYYFWEACKADYIRFIRMCYRSRIRIGVQDFHSWRQARQYNRLQLQRTLDTESYLRLERMLRRCSPTRWSNLP